MNKKKEKKKKENKKRKEKKEKRNSTFFQSGLFPKVVSEMNMNYLQIDVN